MNRNQITRAGTLSKNENNSEVRAKPAGIFVEHCLMLN